MKFFGVLLLIALSIGFVLKSTNPAGPSGTASGDAVAYISKGEAVEIEKHLEEGNWTLVEFTADW